MKEFDNSSTLYDLTTQEGRIRHNARLYGPMYHNNLFNTFRNSLYSSSTLLKYREILKDYSSHLKNGNYTSEELWKMKYACMGSLHPETQEPINILFRWSSFGPVNIPIIMGLSVLPPTVFLSRFFTLAC